MTSTQKGRDKGTKIGNLGDFQTKGEGSQKLEDLNDVIYG